MIVYPITLPSPPQPKIATLTGQSASGITESPFTGEQQVQSYPAERLMFEVQYPPMTRDEAEEIVGTLLACYGAYGTLLVGSYAGRTARGGIARQGVNLLAWTEAFDNAAWTKAGSGVAAPTVTADAAADPNGATTAEQVAFPATAGGQESYVGQGLGFAPANGEQCTFSMWLRAAAPCSIQLRLVQITGENDVNVACSVTASWQRFSLTRTIAGAGSGQLQARLNQPASSAAVTVFAWGAQLEKAASASAYFGMSDAGGMQANGGVNYLQFSEALDNAAWGKVGSGVGAPTVTADAAADPNGQATAEQVVFAATAGGQEAYLTQTTAAVPVNADKYTFSIWLRAAAPCSIQLRLVQATGENDSNASCSVTASWQRFAFTRTIAGAGAGALIARLDQPASSSGVTLFAWGAQLEKNGLASPYFGTTLGTAGVARMGRTLTVKGLSPNVQNLMKRGDWISLAEGGLQRLHKLVAPISSDSNGGGTAEIYPGLRASPADGALITIANTQGTFRLGDDATKWTIDEAMLYGLQIVVSEAY